MAQRPTVPGTSPDWLHLVHPNGRRRGPAFDFDTSALLVLDMQEYFLNHESHAYVPGSREIVPAIAALADAWRSVKRPVLFTLHGNTDEDAGQMKQWWRDMLVPGSAWHQPHGNLIADGDFVLAKTQYDAFHETDLDAYLSERGVEQLVITGVMTHLCVETTARSAFCRGYAVYLPADTTASLSEEFYHASLRNLSHGVAHICNSDELLQTPGVPRNG